MSIKTIFLDRDGVISKEINYLYKIDEFKFIDGIFDACLYFLKLGYEIVIVTNQSGIARGYFNEDDYQLINHWMLRQFNNKGVAILDVFHCPHGPESTCGCRKPQPGMFLSAKFKHNINMQKSWMVGDKEVDIEAANAAGIKNTILVRSGHLINESTSKAKFFLDSIQQSKKVIID